MQILEEARRILENFDYAVSSSSAEMLRFEDDALMGFICDLRLADILGTWVRRQDDFLKTNAPFLRNSAIKSWNLYSIFLTSDKPDVESQTQLVSIQEDFRATRKIVQAGVETASDVSRALYPLIPIQNIAALQTTDSVRKLRGRLTTLPMQAVNVLLDERVSPESLVRIFQESHETKAH
jgi:hypothetical protein